MNKNRQSNFELMRIISMFFIIGWHFLKYGGVIDNSVGSTNVIAIILFAIFMIHVNSFVLLTGYFNYEKKFKLSKAIKINNSIWFYKVLFLLIFIIFSIGTFSNLEILKNISPIPRFDDYWFLIVYIALYLISPILNVVIKNSDKNTHKYIIIILTVISILSYITNNEFLFGVNNGFSLFSFILLYFVGAYLHKYPIKCSKKKLITISLLLFIIMALFNTVLYYLGNIFIDSEHEIIRYYSSALVTGFESYSSLVVLIGSICYFIIFSLLEFNNKVINFFSKYVLGAYLITENHLFRDYLYKGLRFNQSSYSIKHIGLLLLYSLIILIVCCLLEFIRSSIYKFFYNREFAKKLREKIQLLINKTGLKIKW